MFNPPTFKTTLFKLILQLNLNFIEEHDIPTIIFANQITQSYPIRPVLLSLMTPASEIPKFYIGIIKDCCSSKAKFSIKNSHDLIDKIQVIH